MATPAAVGELKSQGVIEAAQDPNSSVTADDVKRKVEIESKKVGVVALTFDANATPEEKAAQARSHVPEGFHHETKPKGVAIATDIDDGTPGAYDLPEPTTAGALAAPTLKKDKDEKPISNGVNGHISQDDEDQWARFGWTPRFGSGDPKNDEGPSLLDHQTWVEGQLEDKFFGDWYHNTGVIIFACLSSWFVAVLGGGLAWVFIVMAICGTYYRTSLRRVRRNFRDDVNREMAKASIEHDHESLEWINGFMAKFWPIYAPVLAASVVNSVDQVLSTSTPAFLDSMRMSFFTLGSKPPRLEHVKSYPRAEDDVVMMDWKFSFTPNDTADMTARQLKNKINPKVVLEIRIGMAVMSKAMNIIVEDFAFSGLMRVKLKLQIPFPHIERVEICFLERPTIDYVCKPIGGETLGFDINFLPGLQSFIQEQIHANIGPIMYAPNVFPIEVAKMLSGSAVDQAIGVVAITLHGAQGLKNADKFSGNPDPYAVVSLNGGKDALAQTKIVKEDANPKWNETKYIIVTSLKDSLTLQVFDYNEFRKDKKLGTATFALDRLETMPEYENESVEVMENGKARGAVIVDVRYFPVLAGRKLEDGKEEPPPESNTGIARFVVEQAKELDGSKSLVGKLNPYAVMLLNNKEIHVSQKLSHTNNPVWPNGSKEILITDRKTAKLGLVIKDDRGIVGDPILGTYQIKLDDMITLMEKGQEWYKLAGADTGRAKMTLTWKPVNLAGIGGGTGGYVTPIGVMRVHFQNAKDVRNLETMGKSDPYARVLLSGIEKARTVTFQNNLNPTWDEVLYIPMHNTRERLILEVMDQENLGKDRTLGQVEVLASDYIKQSDNGEYLVHDKKTPIAGGLRLNGKGSPKGILNYTVSFYPCLNIADPEEEDEGAKDAEDRPKSASEAGRLSSISDKKDAVELENEKKKAQSTVDSSLVKKLEAGEKEQNELPEEKALPKIRLSPEELVKYETGLIVFKILDADLPRSNVRIEVLVDDMAFPSYVSSTTRSRKVTLDEIGDCFVRELEFSKLTVRVREKNEKDSDKDRSIAKLAGNTLDTLKQCLNNPTTLKLRGEDGQISTVKVSLKYIPVVMELDPSESINNMGTLRVDILDGKDLPSADRNGFSDPFCKFELNGETVFKTQIQKKTLQPVWNEYFEVSIPSRTAAMFKLNCLDWDFAGDDDFLGAALINLELLDPFQPKEYNLHLDGKSGTVRLRMLFRPSYVTRQKIGTGTFSGTFAAPGKIVTGVAGGTAKIAAAPVKGLGKGASFLTRGFKGKKEANGTMDYVEDPPAPVSNGTGFGSLKRSTGLTDTSVPGPAAAAAAAPQVPALDPSHSRTKSGAGSIYSTSSKQVGGSSGTANFTIVSATGYPPSESIMAYVKRVSDKKTIYKTKHIKSSSGEITWNEDFKTTCSPDTQFMLQVKAHSTFGSDDDLGESVFFVDESGSKQDKTIKAGSGTVVLRSNFVLSEPGVDSPSRGVRRSFLSKRDGRASREGTPS